MLRINGATKENATEEVRNLFEEQEKQYGAILNTAKVYGLETDNSKRRAGFAARDSRLRPDSGRSAASALHEGGEHQRLSILNRHQRVQWDAKWSIGGEGGSSVGRLPKKRAVVG